MRSRSAISLMGPIGQIGLIGRREDAELQDGQRPEGKESGFRSLESIWTEDGGSGGHGRRGTGRARSEGKESGFRSLESIWTEDGGSGGHGRGGTGRTRPYRTK